jgi:hypothetical protein
MLFRNGDYPFFVGAQYIAPLLAAFVGARWFVPNAMEPERTLDPCPQ